jgi:thiol:disulfide interchange protein DsbA
MMSLRKAAAIAVLLIVSLGGAAWAQRAYSILSPAQPTEGGGKVEVIEFFWYGCPHCYHLEPTLSAWLKNLPKDVVFKRVPAAHGGWANLATVYYTLEAMGLVEQLHGKVFDAIHKQNINLGNKSVRDEWLAKQGVDVAKYNDVEKSFAVMTRLNRAKQMSASYKIDSVPQLVVNGKYVINGENGVGVERWMPIVDQAIAAARQEKTAEAPPAAGTAKR